MVAAATCDNLPLCYGDLGDLGTSDYDCNARVQETLEETSIKRWQAMIDAGSVRYDGVAMEACIAELAAGDCRAIEDFPYRGACEPAFEGLLAAGDPCNDTAECPSGGVCQFDGACPGTCGDVRAVGEPCGSNIECGSGICGAGTCRAFRGAGTSCGDDTCDVGFACDDATSGSCVPWSEARTVALGGNCLDDLCEAGLSCAVTGLDMEGELIAECVQPVTSGAACNFSLPDVCPIGEYCQTDGLTPDGTCAPLPSAGQPCATDVDVFAARCAADAICDPGDEMCVPARLREGASCTGNAQCLSDLCASGTCAAQSGCALDEFGTDE